MRETYQIFIDSGAGLLTGDLRLDPQDCSGMIEMYGRPLALSDVRFDGNRRSFQGSVLLEDEHIEFIAEGELEDEVLDIMLHAQSSDQKILMTGFLREEKA